VSNQSPSELAAKRSLRDTQRVDVTAHYRQLIALGREEFLAAAAPAALVRYRPPRAASEGDRTLTIGERGGGDPVPIDPEMTLGGDFQVETLPHGKFSVGEPQMEIFPLVKKAGASFPDRITIGRTANNDVVIADHSVSRLHAYIKALGGGWVVADAGSKNGSWLRGESLEARREKPLGSRAVLRLGDVDLTFYTAADLFDMLAEAP
jgi:hypothetical protein